MIASVGIALFFIPMALHVVEPRLPGWLFWMIGLAWVAAAVLAKAKEVQMKQGGSSGLVELNDEELLIARTLNSFFAQTGLYIVGLFIFSRFFPGMGA